MNKVQWRVLPTKANQDMEQAGAAAAREYLERTGSNSLFAIYEAMVLAAPTPPHVEDDEVCALLPKPEDDSELPIVGEAVYDAWDMAQQWNGCRENFLPVVMRLQAELNSYRDALRLIGQGLAVADGAKNSDAIREEIHELQERDLDQLSLLIESKEALQRQAHSERHRGATSSATDLEALVEKIRAYAIDPITEGIRPPSRLDLQTELERLKNASRWDEITLHSTQEQLRELDDNRLELRNQVRDLLKQQKGHLEPLPPVLNRGNPLTGYRVIKVDNIPDDMMMVGEKLYRLLSAGAAQERKP